MSEQRTRTKNRNTELGDRACFCVSCGWARRFYPGVVEPPEVEVGPRHSIVCHLPIEKLPTPVTVSIKQG